MAIKNSTSTSIDIELNSEVCCWKCGEDLKVVNVDTSTWHGEITLSSTVEPCENCCKGDVGALYAEINDLKRQLMVANFGK